MDSGYRSPLIDFFRRGEVARDVRLVAAQGALSPRAHEQLALLILLSDDPEAMIAASANDTLANLPAEPLAAFLARADVPEPMRAFFAARGIEAGPAPAADALAPIGEAALGDEEPEGGHTDPAVLSSLPIVERMKIAMKGTKAQRAQLIRDSNKLVASAVLSSPKLTESEVEAFAKMANVTEDVLRVIAMNRMWTKNYGVIYGLAKNPKTPPAISMQILSRLNERDIKMIAIDRNVPEAVRLAARKFMVKALK
jgi:hypothetical protein